MNVKTCLFHFPSLITNFKILYWDSRSDKTKKKKKWGGRNLLEVKEVRKEGEEVHEAASKNWEESSSLIDLQRQAKKFFKDSQKPQPPLLFLFFFKTFNFLEIYNKTMEVFISAWYPFTGRNPAFAPEWYFFMTLIFIFSFKSFV